MAAVSVHWQRVVQQAFVDQSQLIVVDQSQLISDPAVDSVQPLACLVLALAGQAHGLWRGLPVAVSVHQVIP